MTPRPLARGCLLLACLLPAAWPLACGPAPAPPHEPFAVASSPPLLVSSSSSPVPSSSSSPSSPALPAPAPPSSGPPAPRAASSPSAPPASSPLASSAPAPASATPAAPAASSPYLGATAAEVRAALGPPGQVRGPRWIFVRETLSCDRRFTTELTFQGGRVVDVKETRTWTGKTCL